MKHGLIMLLLAVFLVIPLVAAENPEFSNPIETKIFMMEEAQTAIIAESCATMTALSVDIIESGSIELEAIINKSWKVILARAAGTVKRFEHPSFLGLT